MPEWSAAEWTSVLSTAFAALAAGASWLTIVLDRRRQREARRPKVSAGVTVDPTTGIVSVRFFNAGGLAVQLAYLIEEETTGKHFGGAVGSGFLGPGAEATQRPGFVSTLKGESRCVWACRDVEDNLHVWAYDGRREQIPRRKYLGAERGDFTLGNLFYRMYPDPLPSRAREIEEKGGS